MLIGPRGRLPPLPASALVNGATTRAGHGFFEFPLGMIGVMLELPQVVNLSPGLRKRGVLVHGHPLTIHVFEMKSLHFSINPRHPVQGVVRVESVASLPSLNIVPKPPVCHRIKLSKTARAD
jgi:hypothetical protein